MSHLFSECYANGGLYVIREFWCRDPDDPTCLKRFLPGQRVKYLGHEFNTQALAGEGKGEAPVWTVKFEAGRHEYEAAHDFFVSEVAWGHLMKFFGDQLKKNEPAADNNSGRSKYGGWGETALIVIGVSIGFWLLMGLLNLVKAGS